MQDLEAKKAGYCAIHHGKDAATAADFKIDGSTTGLTIEPPSKVRVARGPLALTAPQRFVVCAGCALLADMQPAAGCPQSVPLKWLAVVRPPQIPVPTKPTEAAAALTPAAENTPAFGACFVTIDGDSAAVWVK